MLSSRRLPSKNFRVVKFYSVIVSSKRRAQETLLPPPPSIPPCWRRWHKEARSGHQRTEENLLAVSERLMDWRVIEVTFRDHINNQTLSQMSDVNNIVMVTRKSKIGWPRYGQRIVQPTTGGSRASLSAIRGKEKDYSTDLQEDGARMQRIWRVVNGNKWIRIERLWIVILGVWLHLGSSEISTLKVRATLWSWWNNHQTFINSRNFCSEIDPFF